MSRVCRFCRSRPASSREHVVARSRLKTINSFKSDQERNDNIKKEYRGITCDKDSPERGCNNAIGKYEEFSWSNLAQATVWKVLAGNINQVFTEDWLIISNAPPDTILHYEDMLCSAIKSNSKFPDLTYTFDLDASNSELFSKFGIASKSVHFRARQGAAFYSKDSAASNEDAGYLAEANEQGEAELNVLMRLETIEVVTGEAELINLESGERKLFVADYIIYLSADANSHRIAFILPLVGGIVTGWSAEAAIEVGKANFLDILNKNMSNLKITKISPYFEANSSSYQ